MGQVYKVELEGPCGEGEDRNQALKVLHPNVTLNREYVSRFLEEGRLATSFQHEGIVRTYDLFFKEGLLGIRMQYIPDGTLRDRIKPDTHSDPALALQFCLQVAKALAYSHKAGVVHRDVKQENIMVSQNRFVFIF